jgi:hypothetical protein
LIMQILRIKQTVHLVVQARVPVHKEAMIVIK